MANKSNRLTYTIEINEKGKVKIDGLTKSFIEADNAVNKLTADIRKQQAAMSSATTKGLNPMIDKTGLAGATLVELGRTISDSNYGIRGMANNLSQLSTLMITLITTTGGLANGMKALWNAIKGPLGLILAFQVVIALLERFDMQSKKTAEGIEGMHSAVAVAGSDLKILRDVVNDNTISQKELARSVKAANEKYKDLNLALDENGKLTEESRRQIDLKILSLERLAKATAIQKEIEKIYTEIVKNEIAEQEALDEAEENKYANRLKRITNSGKASVRSEEELTEALKRKQDQISETFGEERKSLEERLDLLKKILTDEDLIDELFGRPKGAGKRLRNSLRSFKQQFLNFDKDIEKIRQESLDQFIKDQETRIAKESTDLMMMYRIRTEDFKRRQAERLQEFKESKATLEEKKKAEQEYNESIRLAEQELADVLIQIERRAESKRAEFRLKRTQGVIDTLYKIQQAEADLADSNLRIPAVFAENAITQRMQQLQFEIEYQRGLTQVYEEGTQERADAELMLAQLQKKLADENVSYQRQRFNQINEIYSQGAATIGFISEAIKNKEIRDAGESAEAIEAAQKKAWQIEKMLKISQVIMRTYEAGWLAYGSQLQIGDPTSPLRAKIAQVLTIASGVAQVAAIASTKFDSKSISGAGGGGRGAGPQVEAPDFNVVGASPESQLAQSVSAQQEKPLRAFVVHKDIKEASELDRNIQNTSSLG